jgi:S-layer protein (TIGR01567 family)
MDRNNTLKSITIGIMLMLLIAALCTGTVSAKPIEIRALPGSITAGSDMHLDGFNFSAFHYAIKKGPRGASAEKLDLHFASNGTIEEDGAVYTTKTYKGSTIRFIRFMGCEYRSLDPDKANLLSKILICFDKYDAPEEGNTKKTLATGEIWELKEGYSLVASQVDLVGNKVYLNIYKNGEAVYDEVLKPGDYFVYNETIDGVDDITLFTCHVDSAFRGTDSNVVVLSVVRQYSDNPKKIRIGDEYGDFEVKKIANTTIELKNANTISFSLFEREELLGDWVKFRVSEKGWWGYAYTEIACAAPEVKESTGNSGSPPAETAVANSTTLTLPKARPFRLKRMPVQRKTILHRRLELMPRIRNLFRVSGFSLLSLDFLRLPALDG